MRVQLALQSLEFYLPVQLRLCVPGFNTCRPSSSEVDSILNLESNVPTK